MGYNFAFLQSLKANLQSMNMEEYVLGLRAFPQNKSCKRPWILLIDRNEKNFPKIFDASSSKMQRQWNYQKKSNSLSFPSVSLDKLEKNTCSGLNLISFFTQNPLTSINVLKKYKISNIIARTKQIRRYQWSKADCFIINYIITVMVNL